MRRTDIYQVQTKELLLHLYIAHEPTFLMLKGSTQDTSPTPCIQAGVLALSRFLDELLSLHTQKFAHPHTHPPVLPEAAFEPHNLFLLVS